MLIAGCGEQGAPEPTAPDPVASPTPPPSPEPPAAEVDQGSPEMAVAVVRRYEALIAARDYPAAYALWADEGRASGVSEADFAASFDDYASWSAEVGEPGRIEGAAGSAYIDVPVRVSGTLTEGGPFDIEGTITLRRVNDVPGSTEAQRQWHISNSRVRPGPQ